MLLFLFLCVGNVTLNAHWQRPVNNYARRAYHAGNQNWCIQQHDNGWIYVANNKGLLEFDGVHWNTYPIHNAKTRALKIGADNRIYIGGMGQFGYFSPNRLGGLDYCCLSDSVPDGASPGVIWNILTKGRKVYFQADKNIYCWDRKRISIIEPDSWIYTSQQIGDSLYLATHQGLMLLEGDTLTPLVAFSSIGSVVRMGGLQSYDGKLMVVTRDQGIFLYDGQTLHPYKTLADDFCRKNRIFCVALKGSMLALGSVQNGVCLLNLCTGETEIISIDNGLQNKTVLNMCFDNSDNLWLGLDNGIDHIRMNTHLAFLYGGKSVIGSGYTSRCHLDSYYLGTNQGLYHTTIPSGFNKNEPITFVKGTGGQVWNLREHDGKLFCCSDNGIFLVHGIHAELLENTPKGVWDVVALQGRADVLIAGTYNGLYLLRKQNHRWFVERKIEGLGRSCKEIMVEDESNALWIGNKELGASRITLSDDLKRVTKIRNFSDDGFPRGYDVCFEQQGGDIVITSLDGLWHYDRTLDRLEKYERMENLLDGRKAYSYLKIDNRKNIWYVVNGALKCLRYDSASGGYSASNKENMLRGSLMEGFEDLHFCEDGQVIVGTEDGFTLIRKELLRHTPSPGTLQIRKVYLTGTADSLIYGRSFFYENSKLQIPYAQNSLRIECCAAGHGRLPLYSYCLTKGDDCSTWSDYSESNVKEFTGLSEGIYTFSVKLFTAENVPVVQSSFTFEILPPWYRTWWSYLIYIGIGCALLALFYYRIVNERKRLLVQQELDFLRQKQALQKESEQKDQKINSLKEENLQAELKHKSEELIRSTLNIVRKNEMLQDIRKEVLGISHSIAENNSVTLRRKTLRLLGQIDTNIEHDDDLQAFQTSFDSVHHNFFRYLEENYPDLSHKEKMLCAYIKLNLLSKEIAPLMNISVRGVEISRYRLRKKLGLEEGANLAEFLQHLGKS